MFKVAVIVPIYKSEPFLEKCLKALFEQTLDSIQYIFIDDCSPDNSAILLEKVMSRYPMRKNDCWVIRHEENKGVALTRQEGLNLVDAHYVAYCDSDDWVDLDYYEYLYLLAEKENLDMVCTPLLYEYSDSSKLVKFPYKEENHHNMLLGEGVISGGLANKFVCAQLYKDSQIKFPSLSVGEDAYVSTILRYNSRKTFCVSDVLYHYNQMNVNSIVTCYSKVKCCDMIKCIHLIDSFLSSKKDYSLFRERMIRLKFCIRNQLLFHKELRDLELWKETFPEIGKYILSIKNVSFKLRLLAFLADCGMSKFVVKIVDLRK